MDGISEYKKYTIPVAPPEISPLFPLKFLCEVFIIKVEGLRVGCVLEGTALKKGRRLLNKQKYIFDIPFKQD